MLDNHVIIDRALKRQEVFKNLDQYLKIIKNVVGRVDPDAEIFLFGSVAEGKYIYSSDIDVLIVTRAEAAEIHKDLWKAGVKEPFEIHIHTQEKAEIYKRRTNLIKI